jgi:hypothetical protein
MKRLDLVVAGLTIIGFFGIAFIFQTNSWDQIIQNHVNEVTVGSCGQTISSQSACFRSSSSCTQTNPCVGFGEAASSVAGYWASGNNEGSESYTNGDLDCPNITQFPCTEKATSLPNGSIIYYCGPSDQSISVPNGNYQGINGSC